MRLVCYKRNTLISPLEKFLLLEHQSSNPFQYTGREEDGTGLEYYRARYYGPAFQRFVSEDPIRFQSGDLNLFAYVGNNPINRFDPLGLAETCTWLGVNAGGCIGIGWQMLLEKGLCQDDCGKWKRRSRECLCFCVGAGLWTGASVSSGDASTSIQGWTVSVTPVISVSGDGLVPTGGGPGFGMLYTYQWCSCRVH
jgi:RHS repeat-associated protein